MRMIKLFGWENKTEAQMMAKREEELRYVKKSQIFRLIYREVR